MIDDRVQPGAQAAGRKKPLLRQLIHHGGKHFLRSVLAFQGRHSRIPSTPFLGLDCLPQVATLEANWRQVRAELDRVLERPDDIPAFHDLSVDQARISKGRNWTTYAFLVFGQRIDENRAQCPQTAALLDRLPGLQNAWFSILAPGTVIPPHRGPTRAIVRCHLGLMVPRDRERCWIRVDEQRYSWREGEVVLFDDTYEHEVHNDTPDRRVVLFLDFDRPMDAAGTLANRALLAAMRASPYLKEPLRNIARWNRDLKDRVDLDNLKG